MLFLQENGTPFLGIANVCAYEFKINAHRMQKFVQSIENLLVQMLVQKVVPVETGSIKAQKSYTLVEMQPFFGANGMPPRDNG